MSSIHLLVAIAFGCAACAGNEPGTSPLPTTDVSATFAASTLPVSGVDLVTVGDRAAHTATTLPDGGVFVAGGCVVDGCTTATDATFVISADGRRARVGPTMATPRDSHTAAVTPAGLVVLAGGFPGEGLAVSSSVEIINPATDTIVASNLEQPRGGHASVTLDDGRVLVIGGWIRSRTYTSSVEVIDPAGATIATLSDLPWAADALDAITLDDGRVLVTGGQIAPDVPTAQTAIFDPLTGRWANLAPMAQARLKHFSVLLNDGRVLIIGGDTGNQRITSATEIFDPNTLTFTAGPELSEPRYKLPGGALTLDDGRVLVAGGGATTEVIDVTTSTTTTIDQQSSIGSFATLNKLANGSFIVIGGYDDTIRLRRKLFVITSTELH